MVLINTEDASSVASEPSIHAIDPCTTDAIDSQAHPDEARTSEGNQAGMQMLRGAVLTASVVAALVKTGVMSVNLP